MAHFSRSQVMADAFKGPDDFFCTIASNIYDEPISKKDGRRALTKNTIYGKLYGAGVARMADQANVPVSEMSKFVHIFDTTYPDVKRMQTEVERAGQKRFAETGQAYVITPTGRRLPCDDGRIYTLVNYLIQCHAAEVFKRALVDVDSMIGNYDGMVLLPVHDEIVGQVPKAVAYEATKAVEETMADMTNYIVPITADGAYSDESWAAMVD
jgi:DNA polymerase I-like protein with 3'-5' exonuclease and polymerase domains